MRPPNRSQPLRVSDSPLVKRLAVGCVIAGALLGVFNHRASAELPDKQIRIIVPVAAGSSIDARARVIAHALGVRLKQQPIVENRPGAGGAIGSAYVAKASPDGTTLLFTNDAVVINPHVYRDPGYDAFKDLAPITQAYSAAMVLVVVGSRASTVNRPLSSRYFFISGVMAAQLWLFWPSTIRALSFWPC